MYNTKVMLTLEAVQNRLFFFVSNHVRLYEDAPNKPELYTILMSCLDEIQDPRVRAKMRTAIRNIGVTKIDGDHVDIQLALDHKALKSLTTYLDK